nr:hypothetical protein [uncultured Albidiferax sp.]
MKIPGGKADIPKDLKKVPGWLPGLSQKQNVTNTCLLANQFQDFERRSTTVDALRFNARCRH